MAEIHLQPDTSFFTSTCFSRWYTRTCVCGATGRQAGFGVSGRRKGKERRSVVIMVVTYLRGDEEEGLGGVEAQHLHLQQHHHQQQATSSVSQAAQLMGGRSLGQGWF